MRKRVLIIPHIGTAYGHAIRTGELIFQRFQEGDIYVAIPRNHLTQVRQFFPETVNFIPREEGFLVNNKTGTLDEEQFLRAILEQERIARDIKPDLLVGDPGIQAGVVARRTGIPWIGLMHGIYLPLPSRLQHGQHSEIATRVWAIARRSMDRLVAVGTNGKYTDWNTLRETGGVWIPNTPDVEPSTVGEHIGKLLPRSAWSLGKKPVRCLVTISSAGTNFPPEDQLRKLVAHFGEVSIAEEPNRNLCIDGVRFLGHVAYHSIIDANTTVITHGGHGTLKEVEGANQVIIVPGDLDQLANGLIAAEYKDYKIGISPEWTDRLKSGAPFIREVAWQGINLDELL